jgi:hypothetical protein
MRILIQVYTSMRIRIPGAKPMRNHADPNPGKTLASQKVEIYMMKTIIYEVIGHKTFLVSYESRLEMLKFMFIC